jgi:hypothetical protein
MKKLILLIALSTFRLMVWGQSEKHEFYVTAGIGTAPFIIESLNRLDFFSTDVQKDHENPVMTFGYQYRISNKMKIGPEIIIDRFWMDDREDSYRFNSFLGRCDIIWRETRKVIISSGISAGITSKKAIETFNGVLKERSEIYPVMHLYMLCFDYKVGNFSITINNGLGVSGILNLGIKYRF